MFELRQLPNLDFRTGRGSDGDTDFDTAWTDSKKSSFGSTLSSKNMYTRLINTTKLEYLTKANATESYDFNVEMENDRESVDQQIYSHITGLQLTSEDVSISPKEKEVQWTKETDSIAIGFRLVRCLYKKAITVNRYHSATWTAWAKFEQRVGNVGK
jgi:hypothetical protein